MTTYPVRVWREPTGDWSAEAVGVSGAFTAGRSLAEVERNIRESIAVSLDLPRSAENAMDIRLEVSLPNQDQLVADARHARERAQESSARASDLTLAAAQALRADGLSVRDIAAVLGISPQRAQQLTQNTAA